MGEMRIMDQKEGDIKTIWDKVNKEEVKVAKDQFDALIKKGYIAYKVKKDGEKGGKLDEFDADLEMIILAPAPRKGCIARYMAGFNP
jgi:hypothetical protein